MKLLHEIGSNASKELYDTTKNPSLFSMCSWPYHRKGIRPDGRNLCDVVFVLANMIHQFQRLDLTINGVAKKFSTTKFEE